MKVLLLLLMACMSAFAEDSNGKKNEASIQALKQQRSEIETKIKILEDEQNQKPANASSKTNRKYIDRMITIGPPRIVHRTSQGIDFDGIAGSVGYDELLNSDLTLGVTISHAKSEGIGESKTASYYSLRSKMFFGNSFFLQPEMAYLRTFTKRSGTFAPSIDESLYAVIGIGNEWQWQNFLFSVNWISYARRVANIENFNGQTEEEDLVLSTFNIGYAF